jgi:hypothetical protein
MLYLNHNNELSTLSLRRFPKQPENHYHYTFSRTTFKEIMAFSEQPAALLQPSLAILKR